MAKNLKITIKNAQLAEALKLTREKKPTLQKKEEKESFEKIKEEFTRDLALASFELSQPSRVKTDILDKALGGCLTQLDD